MNRTLDWQIVKNLTVAFALCAVLSSAQTKLDENVSLGLVKDWEFRQVAAGDPFDILPGKTVEIHATASIQLAELKSRLSVIPLSDAFDTNGPAGTAQVR